MPNEHEKNSSKISSIEKWILPRYEHICVPMVAHGDTLGVLYLHLQNSMEDKSASVQELERLALSMTDQISLALANLRLRETLLVQSIRDPLTGLYNLRYLEETLHRELKRVERSQKTVRVIMMDIDHFKKFNDTFGHDAGDAVLREFGTLLKSHNRRGDIACRYGGEEYVLILPETPLKVVQERAEIIRSKVKQLAINHRGKLLGSLSLSLGVALCPKHSTYANELIRLADQALYRAKEAGRDQFAIANNIRNMKDAIDRSYSK